ncbi:MAG: tetratricopeptide repeat protein [Bacteroidales bacterium]
MSNKETQHEHHDQLENVHEALTRTELFFEKNKNKLFLALVAGIAIVAGYLGFQHGYLKPKENEAAAAMFKAQHYFEVDSFKLAVSGNAEFQGFEDIISNYGITKSANLATAYAGISYMKMGDYEKAIKYLKDFDQNDQMVSHVIVGAIGDCYVQMNDVKEGIKHFEKAASQADNDLISPVYLKKAGLAFESLNDFAGAQKIYEKIQNEYPNSAEAMDITKYIERAKLSIKK